MAITTVNGNSIGSHCLPQAQQAVLPTFTVVLNYWTDKPFGLQAYVVKHSNRAAWVGEPPLMSEGYNRSSNRFSLHTGGATVEQSFGVCFAGSKRVGADNGYSLSESRLKFTLDPVHDVRDILLVVTAKVNGQTNQRLAPPLLRELHAVTIVDGNNDSMALAADGMKIDRTFGDRERGTWFVPGIIRIDPTGIAVDTDPSFFGGDDSNPTLPYLDRDGNFMRVAR